MDVDRGPSEPSAATAPDGPPTIKAAPPTSRAIAMFAIVFVFFGLLAVGAWFIGGGATPEDHFCTAEARIVDGQAYGRDIEQDCKFVDANGNVLPNQ